MNRSPKHAAYRTKKSLKAITKMPSGELLMPAGSIFVWKHGEIRNGMAHVSWLNQPARISETDFFAHCERVTEDPDTLV